MTYEAYGIGGTGFVIECLTDNVNRSASDVKAAITKGGGKVGRVGCSGLIDDPANDCVRRGSTPSSVSGSVPSEPTGCCPRTGPLTRGACLPLDGQVADPGSVLFNFQRQGLVMVDAAEGEQAGCFEEVKKEYALGVD